MSHQSLLRGISRPHHSLWSTNDVTAGLLRNVDELTWPTPASLRTLLSAVRVRQWHIMYLSNLVFISDIYLYHCYSCYISLAIIKATHLWRCTCTEVPRRNALHWSVPRRPCNWSVREPIRSHGRRVYSPGTWRVVCLKIRRERGETWMTYPINTVRKLIINNLILREVCAISTARQTRNLL